MSDQQKPTTPAQDQSYSAPTIVPYPPQGYNAAGFPPPGPGAYVPPMFAYPSPPDGNHPEAQSGSVPAPPYVIPFPPGLVYAYPPHPQTSGFGPPPPSAGSPSTVRPKRKQVKMACTNCANACKRCDEHRPCERCLKYGTAESCVDGVRKERKKGVKRGPYKRKSKEQDEGSNFDPLEWPNGQPPPPATTSSSAPYTQEGYYHVYYPPGAFIPHPPDGQPSTEGGPAPPNGQHVIPYFIPGPYPPFHYPQLYPQPPPAPQPPTSASSSSLPTSSPTGQHQTEAPPSTINPADTSRKPPAGTATAVVDPALTTTVNTSKKRSRTTKSGEHKTKKAKIGGASREGKPRDEPSEKPLDDEDNSG